MDVLQPFAVGDTFYADTTTSLAKLADVAVGNALLSGGVGAAPAWGKVAMSTAISGILPAVNGGTGVNNAGTITNASNTTITGGGTLALGGFTLTVPATGTAGLLGTANTWTQGNTFTGSASTPSNGQSIIGGGTVASYNASGDSFKAINAAGATARFSVGAVDASDTNGRMLFGWGDALERGEINAFKNGAYKAIVLDATSFTFGQGPIIAPAATTSITSIRLPHGSAPSSPTNGDMWTTTSGLFVRINGSTIGPLT